MAIDPAFRACFNQVISTSKPSGTEVNDFGECARAAPVAQAARVEPQSRIITMRDGTQRHVDTLVIVENEIEDQDLVWLPGTDNTQADQARLPAEVGVGIAEDGTPHHYEVSL